MINGDFIAFYEKTYSVDRRIQVYHIYNGFSSINKEIQVRWLDANNIGEFVPKNDAVFISCWFQEHHDIACLWASSYPHVKFVLGGCVYHSGWLRAKTKPFPKNVFITEQTLQEYFKLTETKWSLSFPFNDMPLRYSFGTGAVCYWQKCSFCNPTTKGTCQKYDFDVKCLAAAPNGFIFLSNPSMSPAMLYNVLPELPTDNKKYAIYLRGGTEELQAIKNLNVDWTKLYFHIGVEYPSNRMLKIMNKGVTVKEYINMVNFLQSKEARLILFFITDWPDLLVKDLMPAKEFLHEIDSSKTKIVYWPLYLRRPAGKLQNFNLFESYKPELSEKAKEINDIWTNMLYMHNAVNRQEDAKGRRLSEK